MYYHPDIRQVLAALSSPSALVLKSSKQPQTAQALLSPPPPSEASKGSSRVGDQIQGVEVAKDKDKETKPPSEAKDAAKSRDAIVKAKEIEARSKEADPKAKDAPTSQSSKKKDPPPPKSKA